MPTIARPRRLAVAHRPSRRLVLSLAGAAVLSVTTLGCSGGSTPPSAGAIRPTGAHHAPRQTGERAIWPVLQQATPPGEPSFRFLNSPDFLNCDVGDLRKLPGFHVSSRTPNSWNAAYAQALRTVMDTFAAEKPDAVLVPGDLVEGHWGADTDHTGTFGPTRTTQQRVAAVRRAGNFYFGQWLERFTSRHLKVYPAVGDHDIGDNPWGAHSRKPWIRFKHAHVGVWKNLFYRNLLRHHHFQMRPPGPAHDTAYATYLDPDVLLVTVDVFDRTKNDVISHLDPQQLAWLDRVLDRADRRGVPWIIVQGHDPVLGPVRTWGSSAMYYRGGAKSAFWKTMARHHVDLYLDGEVHDVTAMHRDGITQISAGGTIQAATPSGRGGTNYVVGEIYGDKLYLRDNRFVPSLTERGNNLWQTATAGQPIEYKELHPDPPVIGTMVISQDNEILSHDGALTPYHE